MNLVPFEVVHTCFHFVLGTFQAKAPMYVLLVRLRGAISMDGLLIELMSCEKPCNYAAGNLPGSTSPLLGRLCSLSHTQIVACN